MRSFEIFSDCSIHSDFLKLLQDIKKQLCENGTVKAGDY